MSAHSVSQRRPLPWRSIRNSLWITPVALLTVFTVVSVVLLVSVSLGGIEIGVTQVPEGRTAWEVVIGGPAFWTVAAQSVVLALAVAVVTVAVSYLTALSIATIRSRSIVMTMYALIVTPLIVSVVVRIYSWELIFGSQGVITGFLVATGLVEPGTNLLSNSVGVAFVFIVSALPIAYFPIQAALRQTSADYAEAAATLGSGRIRSFFSITLPLTLPTALVSAQLVFIATMGSFGIPSLVGRGKVQTFAAEVWQSTAALDWVRAGVLVLILLIIGLVVVSLVSLLTRRSFAAGSGGK